jgi:peptide chain release factor subunit 1
VTGLTAERIRALAAMANHDGGAPVVSCYLDVDGRRRPRPADYEAALGRMVKPVRDHADGHASCRDLQRIEERVRDGVDRSTTRGLALFSSVAAGLWEVLELAVPVRDQLVVDRAPRLRQLEYLLQAHDRYAVVLADRQRARLFLFELGRLVERTELFDQLPRHDDDGGEWDRDHVRDHAAASARRHLRQAARAAFELNRERGFDHLVVAGPDELVAELHPYLRERLVAHPSLPASAPPGEVARAVAAIEERVEREREAAAVGRLRDTLGRGGLAVAGLAATLDAMADRRVDTLLVSDGFEAPGWRCPGCHGLAARGPGCPRCQGAMARLADVVEEALDDAIGLSCKVVVCRDDADLDVLGRIGALLRY